MFKYRISDFYCVDDYNKDYLKEYLRAIGITNFDSFLIAPKEEDELDPFLLKNMDKAIRITKKAIEDNKNMYLVVD